MRQTYVMTPLKPEHGDRELGGKIHQFNIIVMLTVAAIDYMMRSEMPLTG